MKNRRPLVRRHPLALPSHPAPLAAQSVLPGLFSGLRESGSCFPLSVKLDLGILLPEALNQVRKVVQKGLNHRGNFAVRRSWRPTDGFAFLKLKFSSHLYDD